MGYLGQPSLSDSPEASLYEIALAAGQAAMADAAATKQEYMMRAKILIDLATQAFVLLRSLLLNPKL